ncbi:MAG: hypothetical protein WCK26_02725 [Candidatus Saccharibacteria bacterium]
MLVNKNFKSSINPIFLIILVSIVAIAFSFLNSNRSSSQTTWTQTLPTTKPCARISVSNLGNGTELPPVADISITNIDNRQPTDMTIIASNGPDTKEIGLAKVSSPSVSTTTWNFKWITAVWPYWSNRNPITISAKINYSSGDPCTIYSNTQYSLIHATQSYVTVALTGQTDTVTVGSTYSYNVKVKINDFDVFDLTQYSILKWNTLNRIGFLSYGSSDSQRIFNSGSIPGNNSILLNAQYGGVVIEKSLNLSIKPLDTTSTTKPTTDVVAVPDTPVLIGTYTVTPITSSQVQLTPISTTCIEKELTVKRYTSIDSGASRPTAKEFTSIQPCFAESNYIIPTNFIPVDPTKVSNLDVDESISSISSIENVTKKVDSKDETTLKIAGKTTPNNTVLLYLFSDPIIITTKSDEEGNWEYTIEDPLEPGKHEIYAIVDNGDGVYKRSDPTSFLISTAGATEGNPKGLSLKLSEPPKKTPIQSNLSLIIYIVGAVTALVISLTGLYIIIRSHNRHKIKIAKIIKKSENDNLTCPHCDNLLGEVKKND